MAHLWKSMIDILSDIANTKFSFLVGFDEETKTYRVLTYKLNPTFGRKDQRYRIMREGLGLTLSEAYNNWQVSKEGSIILTLNGLERTI